MTSIRRWLREIVNEPQDRFGLLLALLLAAFMVSGIDGGGVTRLAVGLLNLLAVVVTFTSSGLRAHAPRVGALVALAIVGSILVSPYRGSAETSAGAYLQVAILTTMTLGVLGRVLRHREVDHQTLLGAVAAYFLIGQVFAWLYLALPDFADGGVLDPTNAGEIPMYYSYVVLTTLGFGDVVPVGEFAARVTVLEALIGQMFLAILVARLVAMYSRNDSVSTSDV